MCNPLGILEHGRALYAKYLTFFFKKAEVKIKMELKISYTKTFCKYCWHHCCLSLAS